MLAVPPKTRESAEIDKIVAKVARKEKRHDETVLTTWKVWMPYHRIWIACSPVEDSRPERIVTALNAVFCVCTKTERELLQIFRPRHLERPLMETYPDSTELVCPHPEADLNGIIGGLIKTRAEIQDQLSQIEPQQAKTDRKMQWEHLILPIPTSYLKRQQATSTKSVELRSRSMAIDLCLNLTRSLQPTRIEEHDIIYIPMSVAQLKENANNKDRYVLVDLATWKLDSALTSLCELEASFKSQLSSTLR